MSLQSSQSHYLPGEPIAIEAQIQNVTAESLRIWTDHSNPVGLLRLSIRTPARTTAPLTMWGKDCLEGGWDTVNLVQTEILPGACTMQRIALLNRFYDMTLSGKFLVTARISVPQRSTQKGAAELTSNQIEIEVHS